MPCSGLWDDILLLPVPAVTGLQETPSVLLALPARDLCNAKGSAVQRSSYRTDAMFFVCIYADVQLCRGYLFGVLGISRSKRRISVSHCLYILVGCNSRECSFVTFSAAGYQAVVKRNACSHLDGNKLRLSFAVNFRYASVNDQLIATTVSNRLDAWSLVSSRRLQKTKKQEKKSIL